MRKMAVLTAAAALSAALVTGTAAAPAMALGGGGQPAPPTSSASNSNGVFTVQAAQNISLSGNVNPGGYDPTYTPPECWLQPEFKQPETYKAGDPSGGPTDADSFWFWFGSQRPGFGQFLHGTNATPQVNKQFQQEQNKKVPAAWTGPNPITSSDVWWAPNWLQNAGGYACAQGLVSSDNLSDGYLGMEPPAPPGTSTGLGQITGKQLAGLARAALRLPTVTVVTSPPSTASATVNVPTYVGVKYSSTPTPSDQAAVNYQDGALYLSAQVKAAPPTVAISANAPSGTYTVKSDNKCAAAGGQATSACSITFHTPSAGTPFRITATVTWTVTWTTNVGGAGTFPATQKHGVSTLKVHEIQTQT